MPDVGVLELKIRDDASTAAGGLDRLTGALSDVQKAASNGLSLSGISRSLNTFAKAVSDNSTTLSKIGTFLNAVTNYTTAFSKLNAVKFNSKPIDELKAAIGDGIKIGQAGSQINILRTALSGDWSTATQNADAASTALKTIAEGASALKGISLGTSAKGISAIAKALNEYAASCAKLREAVGVAGGSGNAVSSVVNESQYGPEGTGQSKGRLGLKLQFFGGKSDSTSSGNWRDQMAGIEQVNSAIQQVDPGDVTNISALAQTIKELNQASGGANLSAYAEGLTAIARASERGANSYHTLTYLATALSKVKEASTGFKLPDFSRLENLARTLQENFNAENGLLRIAKGMEAIKAASEGFKMPNVKGIEKVIAAMNGQSVGGGKPVEESAQNVQSMPETFQQINSSVQEATTALTQFNSELATTLELIQGSGFAGTASEFMEAFATMNSSRMAGSLESGSSGLAVMKDFGEGAIEAEGYVSDAMDGIAGYLESGESSIQSYSTELKEGIGEAARDGATEFREAFEEMDSYRMQFALPAGSGGSAASAQESGPFAMLGDGAVEVEGTVSEAMDSIAGYIEGVKEEAAEVPEIAEEVAESISTVASIPDDIVKQYEKDIHEMYEQTRMMKVNVFNNDENKSWGFEEREAYIKKIEEIEEQTEALRRKWEELTGTQRASKEEVDAYFKAMSEQTKQFSAMDQKKMEDKYAAFPKRTLEDYYNGLRYQKLDDGSIAKAYKPDLMSAALQGNGTPNEELFAFKTLASELGMPLEEVKQRIAELREEAERSTNGIQDFINALNQPIDWKGLGQGVDRMQGIGAEAKSAEESMRVFLEAMGGESAQAQKLQVDNPELAQFKQQMDEAGVSAKDFTGKLVDVDGELKSKKKDADEAAGGFLGLKETFSDLIKTFKTTVIGKLASQFARLAKRMAMRAIIKQISAAFKEGVENVYRYSNAIGGTFAASMDKTASSLAQMKNSIGAAVAPAIQMLLPYINQLINSFIQAVNWVNQLFALMNGQKTWTRALPQATKAFDDQKKAAKGASSAMKDLLADWDELNIIQSESGGGGGSAVADATDYTTMFEEVDQFDSKIQDIAAILKDIISFVTSHLAEILAIVTIIKNAAKLAKFSKAFTGVIGDILGFVAAGLVIKLTVDAVVTLNDKFLETGEEGYLVGNLLVSLLGGFFAQKVLKNVMGGKVAQFGIPITLAVTAIADIVTLIGHNDVSALSKKGLELSAVSALKAGGAAAFIAKSVMGKTLGTSLLGGAAVALATFGVAIGIKTTVQAVQSGITEETIKGAAISSIAIGVGAGMLSKVLGASLMASVGIGAAAAGITIATIAAVIAISAALKMSEENDPIKWGDYEATEAQIQAFVLEKGFNADIVATLSLVDSKVRVLPDERTKIEEEAAKLIPTLQVIKYGLATEDTYEQLKTDLFGEDGEGGVVGQIKSYAKEQKTLIQTSFTLVPIVDETGAVNEEATKEFMQAGITGWDTVEKYMGDIGSRLAEALKGKTINGIKTFDDELILELTNKLNNVQNAVTQAQVSSEGTGWLLTGLTGVTKNTFNKAFAVWDDYKNQLKEKYKGMLQEELTSYKSLEAFYTARGEAGDAELAEYYGNKAQQLVDMWEKRLEAAVWKMSDPGREIFRKTILEMLNFNITDYDINAAFISAGLSTRDVWGQYFYRLFEGDGTVKKDASDTFKELLNDILRNVFGGDYDTIEKLINSGALGYNDLIDKGIFGSIVEQFFAEGDNEKYRKAWNEFINEIFSDKKFVEPEIEVDPKVTYDSEKVESAVSESANGGTSVTGVVENQAVKEAKETVSELKEVETEAATTKKQIDSYSEFDFDTNGLESSANTAATSIEDMAQRIREAFATLDGLTYEMDINGALYSGAMKVLIPKIERKASGGFVRSGDLVLANENGQFEMMGRMGNQPVIANNQQIVNGISQGVSQANSGVESRLSTIETMLNRILQKEFVARAVPSSGWGQHNVQSREAWDKVTG